MKDSLELEVKFVLSVSNPPWWAKAREVVTLGLWVAADEQRKALRVEAEQFANAIKTEIDTDLIPKIQYVIGKIPISAEKLAKRKPKNWVKRLARWALKRLAS